MSLTPGSIQRMFSMNGSADDPSFLPAVQVLYLKTIDPEGGAADDRWKVVLSDGNHFLSGMCATKLNPKVNSGEIARFAIININEFVVNKMPSGQTIIILLRCDLVLNPGQRIGQPVDMFKVENVATAHVQPSGGGGGALRNNAITIATMTSDNDRNKSTGGVNSGDESSPSANLELRVLTVAPSSSFAKNANGMHFAEAIVADLSVDELAIVFSYLTPIEIMRARVCTTWRDAAKLTLVPHSDFKVKDLRSYNAVSVMATALPNLQQLSICDDFSCYEYNYADGEDPNEAVTVTRNAYLHHHDLDINILSNFSRLQVLTVENWDLGMLSGLPLLEELHLCHSSKYVTGNLKNLRVLRNTLRIVNLKFCYNIDGNFMDLADFPHLKELRLSGTYGVTGDIRHIHEHDFPAMRGLSLPLTVVGGRLYEFQHVSDVPSFMQSILPLLKRSIFDRAEVFDFDWSLSEASPDWYSREGRHPSPPFYLKFLLAGSRLGWCWACSPTSCHFCEVNWLGPEPRSDSEDYQAYYEKHLQNIESCIDVYRGYYQPPTEQEYRRLCEEYSRATTEA